MISLKVLAIFAFLAVAHSQPTQLAPFSGPCNSSELYVDNYLDQNRKQFSFNIVKYIHEIENFKTLYIERINMLKLQQSLLMNFVAQTNAYLRPLELLNDVNRACVKKYKNIVPPMEAVKYNMDLCITAANNQLNAMLTNPSNTNRTLQSYYSVNFENAIKTCQKNYPIVNSTHTTCLQNAVSAANTYTINNQKTFANQIDASENTANLYVKRAAECSFDTHNITMSSTAQAHTLIDLCIRGVDCSKSITTAIKV